MSDEFRNADELNAVEAAFAALKPRASGVDRDRLLYLAGQTAALSTAPIFPSPTSRRWIWPAATMVSVAAAVVFGVLYLGERAAAEPRVQYVYIEKPTRSEATLVRSSSSVTRKRNETPLRPGHLAGEMSSPFPHRFRTESAMLRSRHPILTTDVDRLPMSPSSGTATGVAPQTLQEMRLSLVTEPKTALEKPSSKSPGFGLFQWSWPSTRRDRL